MEAGSLDVAAWRSALDTLERLVSLEAAERSRRLADLERSEPETYRAVRTLLEADAQAAAAGFLEADALAALRDSAGAPAGPSSARAGERLGPYELLRPLGAGGMGEVWLARRDHGGYTREVALKLLRPDLASSSVRARFTREGRLLAQMSHPNIAQLLDAGSDELGRLYLVLEYVDGVRIDAWCDRRAFGVSERLRLLLDVCRAVAHAHGRLIVHRDLKPENVLVTRDGTVKLLDFGIAKLLEDEHRTDDALTALTRLDGRVMTPQYAAPEQVLSAPITTATDVHALGALLYLLLSGRPPFGDSATLSRADLTRAVLEQDPVPPSQAATRPDLRRTLRGDLDAICGKALRKDPVERYVSALALAEDIERHLRHEPVVARAGLRGYRASRFLRRHRAILAGTAVGVAALLAGLVVSLWQAGVAREQAARATAIQNFLIGIFERNSVAHPDGARARETTAEDLLAQSTREIRSGLAETPELRGELLGVMSRLYASLDLQKQALSLLQDKLETDRRLHGEDSLEVARTLSRLAYSQIQIGDWTTAETTALRSIALFERHGADSELDYALAYGHLGQAAMRLGKLQDGSSRNHYRRALTLIETHHPADPARIEMLHGLSRAATHDSQHERSLAYARQAFALVERGEVKVDGMTRGGIHQRLGNALHWLSRYDEAEKHMRAAIVDYQRAGGREHPFTLDGKRELGVFLLWTGRRQEARRLLGEVLAAQARVKGGDDPELTTHARSDYANLLLLRGEFAAAEPELLRAMAVWQRTGGSQVTRPRMDLSRIRLDQGRLDEAARLTEGIEFDIVAVFGRGSWSHAAAVVRLGQIAAARGDADEARRTFERVWNEWPEPDDALTANRAAAALGLVRLEIAAQARDAARRRAAALLAAIERSSARPDMPDQEAEVHLRLGQLAVLDAEARGPSGPSGPLAPDALRHLEHAARMRAAMDAPESVWLAEARLWLARARWQNGERDAARALLGQARDGLAHHPSLAARYLELLRETARRLNG